MQTWIKRLLILSLVVYGGYRAVEWIERMGEGRHTAQEEMARQVAEKKSEQMQRAISGGNAIRTGALREQVQQATGARDSLAVPR